MSHSIEEGEERHEESSDYLSSLSCATTLLQERPKPERPITIMVFQNLRFSVRMALAGLAQFHEKEICKPRVGRLGRQSNPFNFKA
jgi:hypothetical protein